MISSLKIVKTYENEIYEKVKYSTNQYDCISSNLLDCKIIFYDMLAAAEETSFDMIDVKNLDNSFGNKILNDFTNLISHHYDNLSFSEIISTNLHKDQDVNGFFWGYNIKEIDDLNMNEYKFVNITNELLRLWEISSSVKPSLFCPVRDLV